MRRSDAVSIIVKAICEYNESIGDFAGYGAGSADSVLEALEKAGMLPPIMELVILEDGPLTGHEWEEEDD